MDEFERQRKIDSDKMFPKPCHGMKPKLKMNWNWKDVAQMWWLFVCLALLCLMALYVKANFCPHRCKEGEAYDAVTRKCVKISPEESVVVYNPTTTIRIECSKEIEDKQCAGRISPECEPECHGECTKAETTETAKTVKAVMEIR